MSNSFIYNNINNSNYCLDEMRNYSNAFVTHTGTIIPNRIFVGGLSPNVTEDELKSFFSKYGPVNNVKIVLDKFAVGKGPYGFVTFESEETAQKILCYKTEPIYFNDRKLNISQAVVKKQNFVAPPQVVDQSPVFPDFFQILNNCSIFNALLSSPQLSPYLMPQAMNSLTDMSTTNQLCLPSAQPPNSIEATSSFLNVHPGLFTPPCSNSSVASTTPPESYSSPPNLSQSFTNFYSAQQPPQWPTHYRNNNNNNNNGVGYPFQAPNYQTFGHLQPRNPSSGLSLSQYNQVSQTKGHQEQTNLLMNNRRCASMNDFEQLIPFKRIKSDQ